MARGSPLARSAVPTLPPQTVVAGWEISARQSNSPLRLADYTPLAKVLVRAPHHGRFAESLGVPLGHAARRNGALVVISAPEEWLLLGPPTTAGRLMAMVPQDSDELVSVIDLTHAHSLMRVTGSHAPDLFAKVCAVDLSDTITPTGTALRTYVARVVCELIRVDRGPDRSYLVRCDWSYGKYLFETLQVAGEEFGIEIDAFETDIHLVAAQAS